MGNIRPDRKIAKTNKLKWEEKQMYGDFNLQANKIALR